MRKELSPGYHRGYCLMKTLVKLAVFIKGVKFMRESEREGVCDVFMSVVCGWMIFCSFSSLSVCLFVRFEKGKGEKFTSFLRLKRTNSISLIKRRNIICFHI